MKKKKTNVRGITLISLVITIVLLLILAGVAINLAVDSDGLFGKAGEAANKWNTAVNDESTKISELLNRLEEIENDAGLADIELVNVRDLYEQQSGYISDFGEIVNNESSIYVRIPVEAGETWYVWYEDKNILSSGTGALRYENSSKEKVGYLDMSKQPGYQFNRESNVIGALMAIPDGVSYMCVKLKFVDYFDYTESAVIAKIDYDFNSTWIALGDSLTDFNYTANKNWLHLSAQNLSANYYNHAVGGRGYLKNGGFSERFNLLPESNNIDLMVFFGSFNDLSTDTEIGVATDIYVEGGDNSIAACMNYSYDYIQTKYPNAKLAVIAPTPWGYLNPADTTSEATQYVSVMEEICAARGIPFLDLFHNSGMTPWDDDYNNKYFYNADGTHPNDEGQKILASKITPFLKSVLNNYIANLSNSSNKLSGR